MSLLRLSVCLVLAGCATPQAQVSTHDAKAVDSKPRTDVDRVLDEATLEQQERAVLFERRFAQAKALWRAQRTQEALEATEHALLLRPGDAEATAFRDNLKRDLGYRSGSVSVLATEEAARYAANLEEERLSVQRLLARAEQNKQSGHWDEARRNYEAALFVLRTSRFRDDESYRGLARDATQRAERLTDERDASEKARRERETAAALREIDRQGSGSNG